jgi:hypothetical protein
VTSDVHRPGWRIHRRCITTTAPAGPGLRVSYARPSVRFDMCPILRGKCAALAKAAIESELKSVEIHTPSWGLPVIVRRLKWQIRGRAAKALFGPRQTLGFLPVFSGTVKERLLQSLVALRFDTTGADPQAGESGVPLTLPSLELCCRSINTNPLCMQSSRGKRRAFVALFCSRKALAMNPVPVHGASGPLCPGCPL